MGETLKVYQVILNTTVLNSPIKNIHVYNTTDYRNKAPENPKKWDKPW